MNKSCGILFIGLILIIAACEKITPVVSPAVSETQIPSEKLKLNSTYPTTPSVALTITRSSTSTRSPISSY
jgi:hypothetical protein